QLDCAQIAKECLSPLASDVVALINRMGGVANYDNIVLVGGGSPLVFEYLRAALPDANLLMADNAEEVRWANALGGVKALRALAARGDF
ncbi:MAG: hypothetical protein NZ571_16215, partial [Anaerolineae bacterium]|nr:hypothetical protein [Anaerolineae bacterium]